MSPMTDTKLKGRHAIVTGGSRGIGYAIARQLLESGARVTIMGRGIQALDQAVDQLKSHGDIAAEPVDIAEEASVQESFARARQAWGPADILVNNAGQAVSQRFDRVTAAEWHTLLAVNLSGTFYCMQAVLPHMLERRWGRIVNVASTAGLTGYAYVSAYCAAKHGVVGLTRAVALETATKGVTVNAVCPGYTETDIVHDAIANIREKTGMSEQDARARLAQRNPQARLVQPDEVAGAVVWLCQPSAASINGQSIPVDGGEVMVG